MISLYSVLPSRKCLFFFSWSMILSSAALRTYIQNPTFCFYLTFPGDTETIYSIRWNCSWRFISSRLIWTQRLLARLSWCKWWRQWGYNGRSWIIILGHTKFISLSFCFWWLAVVHIESNKHETVLRGNPRTGRKTTIF